jgi:signal transduction histidine kinase
MINRGKMTRIVLLSLFMGAVAFGIGVIYVLGDRVQNIKTAEQSDPLWIASQLQFELIRLENELGEYALGFKSAADVAMRFDIAWSRVNVLQEGKMPRLIENFHVDASVLPAIEATFHSLDGEIQNLKIHSLSDADRRQAAQDILATLDGFDLMVRDFLLALAQAKSDSMAEFRNGLLSLSHAIAYLSATILSLLGIFIFLLLSELRATKRTESQMRKLAREATAASRSKTNFMSVVSHELRTPLTSILGGLALLKGKFGDTMKDEGVAKLLDVAHRNGERLLALVNDILDAQSLSEGKVSVESKAVDLNQIVAAAVENCHAYAETLGVSYAVNTSGKEMRALTDSARVTQILVNLISNAAKFTSAGDEVRIDVSRRGQRARVEVIDHGKGIPIDEQSNIFSRFHQVNPGTTGANKSSGLGLSITKQLIDLLGGEIGFESTEGRGSTFWIELDLLPQERSRQSTEPLVRQSVETLA